MLNVKRRCKLNLNANDDVYFNNNNNISIKQEKDVQKFCLQHNNCNCSTPEVRIRILSIFGPIMISFDLDINKK